MSHCQDKKHLQNTHTSCKKKRFSYKSVPYRFRRFLDKKRICPRLSPVFTHRHWDIYHLCWTEQRALIAFFSPSRARVQTISSTRTPRSGGHTNRRQNHVGWGPTSAINDCTAGQNRKGAAVVKHSHQRDGGVPVRQNGKSAPPTDTSLTVRARLGAHARVLFVYHYEDQILYYYNKKYTFFFFGAIEFSIPELSTDRTLLRLSWL